MYITIRELRSIIKEEVERNSRWTAGLFGGGQSGGYHGGDGVLPPPGLGSSEESEDYGEKEEERLGQFGAKARGTRRRDRVARHDRRGVAGHSV
jgi:hypothetical protein